MSGHKMGFFQSQGSHPESAGGRRHEYLSLKGVVRNLNLYAVFMTPILLIVDMISTLLIISVNGALDGNT